MNLNLSAGPDSTLIRNGYMGMDNLMKAYHIVAELMQNIGDNTSKLWYQRNPKVTTGLDTILDKKNGLWARPQVIKLVDEINNRVVMIDKGIGFEIIIDPATCTIVFLQIGQSIPPAEQFLTTGGSTKQTATSLDTEAICALRHSNRDTRFTESKSALPSAPTPPLSGRHGFGLKQMLILCTHYHWFLEIAGTFQVHSDGERQWSILSPFTHLSTKLLHLKGEVKPWSSVGGLSNTEVNCFSPQTRQLLRHGRKDLLIHRLRFSNGSFLLPYVRVSCFFFILFILWIDEFKPSVDDLWKMVLASFLPIRLAAAAQRYTVPFNSEAPSSIGTTKDRIAAVDIEDDLPSASYLNLIPIFWDSSYQSETQRIGLASRGSKKKVILRVTFTDDITTFSSPARGLSVRSDPFRTVIRQIMDQLIAPILEDFRFMSLASLKEHWIVQVVGDLYQHPTSNWAQEFFDIFFSDYQMKRLGGKFIPEDVVSLEPRHPHHWSFIEYKIVPYPLHVVDESNPFYGWLNNNYDHESQEEKPLPFRCVNQADYIVNYLRVETKWLNTEEVTNLDLSKYSPQFRTYLSILVKVIHFFQRHSDKLIDCLSVHVKAGQAVTVNFVLFSPSTLFLWNRFCPHT